MSEQDEFDARLAAHFEQEHRHVPSDAFVAATMRRVRAGSRRRDFVRIGLRVAALVAVVIASPWLIAGVARLNESLESSISLAAGLPGAWPLGALAFLVVLATRVRRR